ncbi:hypothetical protein [Emticicia sp. 17c]|uniref:hypothetical protein n=1 Tax=Emticicia sp. 17c TaxID=3127704 RepID=UPI00301BC883
MLIVTLKHEEIIKPNNGALQAWQHLYNSFPITNQFRTNPYKLLITQKLIGELNNPTPPTGLFEPAFTVFDAGLIELEKALAKGNYRISNYLDDFGSANAREMLIFEQELTAPTRLNLLNTWAKIRANNYLDAAEKILAQRSPEYLQILARTTENTPLISGEYLGYHIFRGKYVMNKARDRVTGLMGGHSWLAVTEPGEITPLSTMVNKEGSPIYNLPAPTASITSASRPVAIESGSNAPFPNGVVQVKLYIWAEHITPSGVTVGGWKLKTGNLGETTLFPRGWTKEQTLQEIAYARWKIPTNGLHIDGNEWQSVSSNGAIKIHMYIGPHSSTLPAFNLPYGSAFPK